MKVLKIKFVFIVFLGLLSSCSLLDIQHVKYKKRYPAFIAQLNNPEESRSDLIAKCYQYETGSALADSGTTEYQGDWHNKMQTYEWVGEVDKLCALLKRDALVEDFQKRFDAIKSLDEPMDRLSRYSGFFISLSNYSGDRKAIVSAIDFSQIESTFESIKINLNESSIRLPDTSIGYDALSEEINKTYKLLELIPANNSMKNALASIKKQKLSSVKEAKRKEKVLICESHLKESSISRSIWNDKISVAYNGIYWGGIKFKEALCNILSGEATTVSFSQKKHRILHLTKKGEQHSKVKVFLEVLPSDSGWQITGVSNNGRYESIDGKERLLLTKLLFSM